MVSISRPMRMDFDQRSKRESDTELFEVVQAPAVIRLIWADPEAATRKAAGRKTIVRSSSWKRRISGFDKRVRPICRPSNFG